MLTHVRPDGKASMVDVGGKPPTDRQAEAIAWVELPPELSRLFRDGELISKKGPVFQTAILAGIMASKKTADLIPLCHPIPLNKCHIRINFASQGLVQINAQVSAHHKTGVEMEALTAASIAALTLYDMCKAYSHGIRILEIKLLAKSGGKSDFKSPSSALNTNPESFAAISLASPGTPTHSKAAATDILSYQTRFETSPEIPTSLPQAPED